MVEDNPSTIFVFSGKRKSGKDFITSLLCQRIGEDLCTILRLSGPLKHQYAKDHNLDFDRLLDATEYKEKYRADMIKWGEDIRNQDPGYFCRLAIQSARPTYQAWIVSDARRPTDVQYFRDTYPDRTVTVRVEADLYTRQQRGFVFQKGIDDAPSECGLDTGVSWDIIVNNNGDENQLVASMQQLVDFFKSKSTNGHR